MGLGRDEDSGSGVNGVTGPVLGSGDIEKSRPVGDGGENLEWLGKRTGLVARENHTDPSDRC